MLYTFDEAILTYFCVCRFGFQMRCCFHSALVFHLHIFFLKVNTFLFFSPPTKWHISHEGRSVWPLVSLNLHVRVSKNIVPLCFYCKCYYFNFSKAQTVYLNPRCWRAHIFSDIALYLSYIFWYKKNLDKLN